MSASWGARIAATAIVLALVVGTMLDRPQPSPRLERAGWRVLQVDLHAHTTFSDGTFSPFDVVLIARRRGLDAVAITEHNLAFPAKLARWFSQRIGGPTVIVGEEITSARAHVVALGIDHGVAPGPLPRVIADVHAQGGLALAAHPVARFWPTLDPVAMSLDGAEVMHPIAWMRARRSGWQWSEMRDWWLRVRDARQKQGEPYAAVGSSDAHFGATLGMDRTFVFAEGDDAASILEAIRAGRTVVWDLDGNAYGDASLVAALAHDPLPTVDRHAYLPKNMLDRATRTIGLFGVLLFLFARRRR